MDSPPDADTAQNHDEDNYDPAEVIDAIAKAMDAYFKGNGDFELDLEKVKLRIYLKGPKWLGVVDKPVADFLIKLEKQLSAEIEKLGIKLPKWERGLLSLKVDDGSWEGLLSYSTEAVAYFKTLAAANQTVVAGVVMAAVGALSTIRRRIDETTPLEAQKIADLNTDLDQQDHQKTVEAPSVMDIEKAGVMKQLDEIQADSPKLQKPIRDLLGLMKDEDVVILPTETEPVKRAEAIKTLEKSTRAARTKKPTYYVDHPYIVEFLDSSVPGKWKVKIRFGTKSFRAGVALAESDLARLFNAYNTSGGKTDVVCPLQVTSEFDAKGEPSASMVVGWGEPRKSSVKLSEAMSQAKKLLTPKSTD